jgi:DNA mismatch endonuclease (patch repair protein)
MRDQRDQALLADLGWQILVLWECHTANGEKLDKALQQFLDP